MAETLGDRVNETAFIDILVEEIITRVNKQHPRSEKARLRVYETIAEKLSGLVRALNGDTKHGVIE